MTTHDNTQGNGSEMPTTGPAGQAGRAALQALGGFIPFIGGLLSAGAGYWSEREQKEVNEFLQAWLKMLQDEFKEKQQVIGEIIARLNIHDEEIAKRVRSEEYQALLRKAFRNWSGAESAKKREYIRNILSNAAATRLASDEVVKLFLDWLQRYSEFHFVVIGDIYRNPGASRAEVWERVGQGDVREDSAEADLFKLLIQDLSMGHIIRQHRETDGAGNFMKAHRPKSQRNGSQLMTSAFEDGKPYVLTALGTQFVHYAMNELTVKIKYQPTVDGAGTGESEADVTDAVV
jgi:hypothetical protein